VPAPHHRQREPRLDVEAEDLRQSDEVVDGEDAGHDLECEEDRSGDEVLEGGALAGRRCEGVDRLAARGGQLVLAGLPSGDLLQPPVESQDAAQREEEREGTQHAPEHGLGSQRVTGLGVERPVVGVGGGAHPRGPAEEVGEVPELLRVGHVPEGERRLRPGAGELPQVVGPELPEGAGVGLGQEDLVRRRVVPGLLEFALYPGLGAVGTHSPRAVVGDHRQRDLVEGLRGEVRPAGAAVPEEAAVLHEGVALEHQLPPRHGRGLDHDLAVGPDHVRHGRRLCIGLDPHEDDAAGAHHEDQEEHPPPVSTSHLRVPLRVESPCDRWIHDGSVLRG
jgi:hypothetical protein